MTKAEGQCKIDAVEVGELSYMQIGSPTPILTVKYAYSNAETGDRFGFGHSNSGWSEETLQALARLAELVERDICGAVFREGATTGTVLALPDATGGIPSL